MRRLRQPLATLTALAALLAAPADARQFRGFAPIAEPESRAAAMPPAARATTTRALPRDTVEHAVREVIASWNTAQMDEFLAAEFNDRTRLLDALDTRAPRDASLRVQSVQGIQTLQQVEVPGADGARGQIVSLVSATVRTQLEFTSAQGALVRRPGVNEFILKISIPAPP
jgi:hypothetical protein